MNVSNNLNTMINLESNLDTNAKKVAQMGTINPTNQSTSQIDAMVEQIEIPMAYTAQGEVIKTKDATQKTLLEIFA